jgi:hypothetical protein
MKLVEPLQKEAATTAADVHQIAADLAAARDEGDFHHKLPARLLLGAVFLLFNFLSVCVVRQGLIALESFSHVAWLPHGMFETLLAVGIQAALASFCVLFPHRLKGVTLGIAWGAAIFACVFWSAEVWLGLLTQSAGGYAPKALEQIEKRSKRLHADLADVGPAMSADVKRQIAWNRTEAKAEAEGRGLTGRTTCKDECRKFLARAMELERRFGSIATVRPVTPLPASPDINRLLVEIQGALGASEDRFLIYREFANVAQAKDVLPPMERRLAAARDEFRALTGMLKHHASMTTKSIALDHAATVLQHLRRAEWQELGPTEWTFTFYAVVLVAGNMFVGVLLAMQTRHASNVARKARRASALDAEAGWDRVLAESEAHAGAAGWKGYLRKRFWRRMGSDDEIGR